MPYSTSKLLEETHCPTTSGNRIPPTLSDDSDNDLIPDRVEVAYGIQYLDVHCGRYTFSVVVKDAPYTSMMLDSDDMTFYRGHGRRWEVQRSQRLGHRRRRHAGWI